MPPRGKDVICVSDANFENPNLAENFFQKLYVLALDKEKISALGYV
jgi:hypothetical protein